jgi:hypothetical protein
MRCDTTRTKGNSSSALVTSPPMRCDSAIEVPGTAAMCSVKWPSFSSGRKPAPKNGSEALPTRVKATAAAIVARGRAMILCRSVSYRRRSQRVTGGSRPVGAASPCALGVLGNSSMHSAGVTVSATTSEARMART